MSKEMIELADELAECGAYPMAGLPGALKFIAGFAMTEAKRDLIVAALRAPAVAEPVRCFGCGSPWTDDDLRRAKTANPLLRSCCPERKPLTIDQWQELAIAHPAPAAPVPADAVDKARAWDAVAAARADERNRAAPVPASVREADYCTWGPPDERKRRWIILFSDPDRGMMIFDDEAEAHTEWDRAKDNWTCTLFETCERKYKWSAGALRSLASLPAPEAAPTREEPTAEAIREILGAHIFASRHYEIRGLDEAANAILALKAAPAK